MRGLFYKEARSLWQYGRSYILMVVIFFALSMANGTQSASGVMWLLYPVFLLASLPASLLSADEKDGWMVYCDTLPVTRRQIVTAKYIACAVLAAAVTLLAMAAAVLRGQTDPLYREQVGSCREFKLVSSMTDGYLMVAEGKADVCICSTGSAKLYAEANGGLAIPDFAFQVNADMQGTRVGMPVGADSLTEFVNGCIDELQEAGQLEAWYQSAVEYAESLGLE